MMFPHKHWFKNSLRPAGRQYAWLWKFLGVVVFSLLTIAIVPATTHAATPTTPLEESKPDLLIPVDQLRDLIERLQRGLGVLNFYNGPISGTVNPATDKAIRAYQKQNNLTPSGIVTRDLVSRIETAANIGKLLDRLSIARQKHTQAAREALLSHPSTRDLLDGKIIDKAADATRDPSICFKAPTVRCLLNEALENAKTINRVELRNWAFGEILVAQARVGLTDSARDTTRHISDPRLIIAALGEIAQAQALSGNQQNALDAAAIIPNTDERVSAYANIAEIMTSLGNLKGAGSAVELLQKDAALLELELKNVAYMSRASVILADIGQTARAEALLDDLEKQVLGISVTTEPTIRDATLRHVASAQAAIGNLEKALNLLNGITSDSEKMPVLMRTAEAQARAGDTNAAMATAQSIAALRYRAVALSIIGIEQAHSGQPAQALKTLSSAIHAREGIQFPFARDYASSRIALAYGELTNGDSTPDPDILIRAISTAEDISDRQLRAKTYWMLAFGRLKARDKAAGEAKDDAIAATLNIESATSQAWLLADLAEKQAKTNNAIWARELYERSLKTAQTITSSWGRARVFAKLSQALMALAEESANVPETQ